MSSNISIMVSRALRGHSRMGCKECAAVGGVCAMSPTPEAAVWLVMRTAAEVH